MAGACCQARGGEQVREAHQGLGERQTSPVESSNARQIWLCSALPCHARVSGWRQAGWA